MTLFQVAPYIQKFGPILETELPLVSSSRLSHSSGYGITKAISEILINEAWKRGTLCLIKLITEFFFPNFLSSIIFFLLSFCLLSFFYLCWDGFFQLAFSTCSYHCLAFYFSSTILSYQFFCRSALFYYSTWNNLWKSKYWNL